MSNQNNQKPIIDLAQVLEDKGVKFRENSSHELIMDTCYNCGRSKKLYVHKETGVFFCFRCDEKGNGVKLLAKYLDISFKEAAKILYGKDAKVNASLSAVKEEEEDLPLQFNLGGLTKMSNQNDLGLPPPIDLGSELVKLTSESNKEAYDYLIKRGYTKEDIDDLNLKVLVYSDFSQAWKNVELRLKKEGLKGDDLKQNVLKIVRCLNRIVFPVYVDHKIYGYVARDFTGKLQPKVLNSTGNFRSFSVWNFDNARASEDLIICEGTTSAVKCGIDRSIALLGKVATSGQIRLIKKTKAKKIYLCLDIGTDKEIQNIYSSLAVSYPGQIYKIELPPVVQLKISLEQYHIDLYNSEFGIRMKFYEGKLLYLDYSDKMKILRELKIDNKLTSDQKKNIFKTKMEEKKHFKEEDISKLSWIIFESEYKDSGDYSHEEMDRYIKEANPIRGGMSLD